MNTSPISQLRTPTPALPRPVLRSPFVLRSFNAGGLAKEDPISIRPYSNLFGGGIPPARHLPLKIPRSAKSGAIKVNQGSEKKFVGWSPARRDPRSTLRPPTSAQRRRSTLFQPLRGSALRHRDLCPPLRYLRLLLFKLPSSVCIRVHLWLTAEFPSPHCGRLARSLAPPSDLRPPASDHGARSACGTGIFGANYPDGSCRCGEMADAQDLKSWDPKKSCRFESDHRHQINKHHGCLSPFFTGVVCCDTSQFTRVTPTLQFGHAISVLPNFLTGLYPEPQNVIDSFVVNQSVTEVPMMSFMDR